MSRPAGPPPPGKVLHITSLANPIVKEIRGLALSKNRKESRLFVAEGLKLVAEAVDAGWTIRRLVHSARVADEALVARLSATAHARGGQVIAVSEAVLAKISRRDNPQTVIGVFEQRLTPAGAIRPAAEAVWVALEGIRDPGNLGTIIRTADAAGAKGIILIGNTCDPWSPEVVRATMGSFAHMPMIRIMQEDFIRWRKNYAGRVIGTHLNAKSADYRSIKTDLPLLLLMGGEQSGLSEEICAACDTLAKIPMTGKTESLNLAVSAGIMLYEIVRSRI